MNEFSEKLTPEARAITLLKEYLLTAGDRKMGKLLTQLTRVMFSTPFGPDQAVVLKCSDEGTRQLLVPLLTQRRHAWTMEEPRDGRVHEEIAFPSLAERPEDLGILLRHHLLRSGNHYIQRGSPFNVGDLFGFAFLCIKRRHRLLPPAPIVTYDGLPELIKYLASELWIPDSNLGSRAIKIESPDGDIKIVVQPLFSFFKAHTIEVPSKTLFRYSPFQDHPYFRSWNAFDLDNTLKIPMDAVLSMEFEKFLGRLNHNMDLNRLVEIRELPSVLREVLQNFPAGKKMKNLIHSEVLSKTEETARSSLLELLEQEDRMGKFIVYADGKQICVDGRDFRLTHNQSKIFFFVLEEIKGGAPSVLKEYALVKLFGDRSPEKLSKLFHDPVLWKLLFDIGPSRGTMTLRKMPDEDRRDNSTHSR